MEKTKKWLEEVIIAHNLCPFAKKPYEAGLIRIAENTSSDAIELTDFFISEVNKLYGSRPSELATSLLCFHNFDGNFRNFLDFADDLEEILTEVKLGDIIQIIIFHPEFQFEGLEFDDRANYVNRSPSPLLHIVRSEELASIISYPEQGKEISFSNEKYLKEMSTSEFLRLFSYLGPQKKII